MKYASLGIYCENSALGYGYEILLKNMVASTSLLPLENLSSSHTSFDFLLIDLSSKKMFSFIHELFYLEETKLILISPYDILELEKSFPEIKRVDCLITKPFSMERLTGFVHKHALLLDRRKILETKNSILAEVVELNPGRIGIFNEEGVLFYANNHYLVANAIDISMIDLITFDTISQCQIEFETIRAHLLSRSVFHKQRLEGKRWYESYFYRILDGYIVHICKDITEQKERELQLEQAAIFFEQSNEALMISDMHGVILSVNTSFCKITGYTKEEAIGKTPHILYSGMHDQHFYAHMWNSLIHNGSWHGEIWNKRKNGEIYPEWLSINKAISHKHNEEFYICVFTDISTIKETDRKLYFYANHDPLTGLANRVNFEAQLKKSIETAKRRATKIAILFIDVDKFKEVNDEYGHSVGDIMLKAITKRLTESIRAEDFVARLGGDEFVIIAGGTETTEGILTLTLKLLESMKEPIKIDNRLFFMTLSIGIAIYPEHGMSAEELIKHADAAMYEVKESGRNGYQIYHSTLSERLSHKLQTQNDLMLALKRDEFELHYQPIIDLQENKTVGIEALVRWNHPTKGLLYPGSFISYIENSDLIYDFGMLVITKALSDWIVIKSTLHVKEPFHISINISAKQFFQEGFVTKLSSLVDDFHMDPARIELELLETHIMKNSEVAQHIFHELHVKGFRLALDDFGTGYSSLSYLKQFTLDKLKIDQSFVRDLLSDENDRLITQTIITMGKIFGMSVQAEGVETAEQERVIRNMGCDLVQGFYHSPALKLSDFIAWYNVHG